MRELTSKEKELINYEIGGYELEFEDIGETYNKEWLVNVIYNELFQYKFFGQDMNEMKFAGQQVIKDYIKRELDNCPKEMFQD